MGRLSPGGASARCGSGAMKRVPSAAVSRPTRESALSGSGAADTPSTRSAPAGALPPAERQRQPLVAVVEQLPRVRAPVLLQFQQQRRLRREVGELPGGEERAE